MSDTNNNPPRTQNLNTDIAVFLGKTQPEEVNFVNTDQLEDSMATSTTPQGVNNNTGLEIATPFIQSKLYGDAIEPYTAATPPVFERKRITQKLK